MSFFFTCSQRGERSKGGPLDPRDVQSYPCGGEKKGGRGDHQPFMEKEKKKKAADVIRLAHRRFMEKGGKVWGTLLLSFASFPW